MPRPDPRVRRPAEPSKLGGILGELMRRRGVQEKAGDAQLAEHWRTAAGDRIADRTRVLDVKNGVLVVGVSSSALLAELTGFHRDALLAAMREALPHNRLRGLKFRLRTSIGRRP